jgi:uncharacterized protein (UPF0335 family)
MSGETHIPETVSAGQLRAFIERIERLEEEIKTANGDKSEVYKEARGCGFDVKAIRQCVAARKLDSAEREERNAIFDLYWSALTGSVHVHTPVREIIEQFDAETGEITEEQPETVADQSTTSEGESDAKSAHVSDLEENLIDRRRQDAAARVECQPFSDFQNAPTESAADTISAPITNPQADSSPDADKTGEVVPPPASPVAISDADVPAFLKKGKTVKPDCLKLKDGHCRIGFETPALCSDCNNARMKARADA